MPSAAREFTKRREFTIDPPSLDHQVRRLSYDPETGTIDPNRVFRALLNIYDEFGMPYPTIPVNRDPEHAVAAPEHPVTAPEHTTVADKSAAPPAATAARRRGRVSDDASNLTGRTNKRGQPITVSRSEGSLKTWETRHAIRRYMEEHPTVTRAEAKAAVKAQDNAPPRQEPAPPRQEEPAPPRARREEPAPPRRVVTGEARKPSQEEIRTGISKYMEDHPTASREEATAIVTARLSARPTVVAEAEAAAEPAAETAEPPIKRGLKGWYTRVENYIKRIKEETGEDIDFEEAKRRITKAA